MSDKTLQHAAFSGLTFLAISLPDLYARSNKFLETEGNCPNWKSRLLHTIAFLVLSHLVIMYVEKPENKSNMMKECIISTLLFFLLSSPEIYKLTNSFGIVKTADENGCPTMSGVVVHSVIFTILKILGQQSNLL